MNTQHNVIPYLLNSDGSVILNHRKAGIYLIVTSSAKEQASVSKIL